VRVDRGPAVFVRPEPAASAPPETIVIEDRSEHAGSTGPAPADAADMIALVDDGSIPSGAAYVIADEPAVTGIAPRGAAGTGPQLRVKAAGPSASRPVSISPAEPAPWFARLTWRTLVPVVLAVWVSGAVFVLLRSVWQIARFEHSLRRAEPADAAIAERVHRLARRIGISRPPSVWLLPGAVSPMLWGLGRRPRLLFPRELLTRLSDDAAETLILHELAHMRRGDHWVRLLELVCQSVYWWHPVVWWGQRQLRLVEEECCDAFVVEQCRGGGVYARALVATIDFLSERRCVMPPAASGIGNLEFLKRRLTMIMRGGVSARLAGLPKLLLLAAAVVCLSVLPKVVQETVAAQERGEGRGARGETDESGEPKAEGGEPKPTAPPEPTVAANAAANVVTQEPIEFETNSRGYPVAQIEVRDLAFSPDGKLLAGGYGKWDTAGEVVVYEFATKRVLKKFPSAKGTASVAFSVDGKYLAASMWNNQLRVWDTATWELVADKVTGSKVARAAFSPDGKYLAYATEGAELKLLNVGAWDEARTFTG
jgi:beta-lactamase regulating signal transducer with metallopeptidase domain